MDGVLIIDKPQGLTSHDVVAVARHCLRERRIGHTGTLDPLATGVLPLACGRATRLVRFFLSADKEYMATVRFGVSTDSYDITGMETARSGRVPPRAEVERALERLRGEYLQVPPAFSAKKIAGERAYSRARRDEQVALAPVPVRVARAELLDFTGPLARIGVTCSAGFYVRSFAHALGEIVGTGASLEALRRTRSGDFTIDHALDLERLRQSAAAVTGGWVPMERLLPRLPAVRLGEEGRRRVRHGQMVGVRHLLDGSDTVAGASDDWVRMFDEEGRLVALATTDSTGQALHPAVVLI
jgi:tRNA pseudouridine55 synthase